MVLALRTFLSQNGFRDDQMIKQFSSFVPLFYGSVECAFRNKLSSSGPGLGPWSWSNSKVMVKKGPEVQSSQIPKLQSSHAPMLQIS